jgi:hypothetical protein
MADQANPRSELKPEPSSELKPEPPRIIQNVYWFLKEGRRHWRLIVFTTVVLVLMWVGGKLDIFDILFRSAEDRVLDIERIPE